MGVVKETDLGGVGYAMFLEGAACADEAKCFYCYQDIELRHDLPAIVWIGEKEIFFHPDCAVEFAIRLMRDVHETRTLDPVCR